MSETCKLFAYSDDQVGENIGGDGVVANIGAYDLCGEGRDFVMVGLVGLNVGHAFVIRN